MSALNLAAVMADLATAVQSVLASGRTAHPHPVEGVQSGDAVVGYPQEDGITLNATFGRGTDRATVPVWVPCGLPQDDSTQTNISGWLDNSASIVTAIEGYAGTWSSVAVLRPSIEPWAPVGGPEQLAVKFPVDVIS